LQLKMKFSFMKSCLRRLTLNKIAASSSDFFREFVKMQVHALIGRNPWDPSAIPSR
jgi:hypothetical protein